MAEVGVREQSGLDRARALLVRQFVAFIRDVREQEISADSRHVADELLALARSLFPDEER